MCGGSVFYRIAVCARGPHRDGSDASATIGDDWISRARHCLDGTLFPRRFSRRVRRGPSVSAPDWVAWQRQAVCWLTHGCSLLVEYNRRADWLIGRRLWLYTDVFSSGRVENVDRFALRARG